MQWASGSKIVLSIIDISKAWSAIVCVCTAVEDHFRFYHNIVDADNR